MTEEQNISDRFKSPSHVYRFKEIRLSYAIASLVSFKLTPWRRRKSRKFGPSHMKTKTGLIRVSPVSDHGSHPEKMFIDQFSFCTASQDDHSEVGTGQVVLGSVPSNDFFR